MDVYNVVFGLFGLGLNELVFERCGDEYDGKLSLMLIFLVLIMLISI